MKIILFVVGHCIYTTKYFLFFCAGGENHRLTWGLVLRTSVYGWQRILHLAKTGQKGNIQLQKYIFVLIFLPINPQMLTTLEMEENPFHTF